MDRNLFFHGIKESQHHTNMFLRVYLCDERILQLKLLLLKWEIFILNKKNKTHDKK